MQVADALYVRQVMSPAFVALVCAADGCNDEHNAHLAVATGLPRHLSLRLDVVPSRLDTTCGCPSGPRHGVAYVAALRMLTSYR